MIIDYEKDTIAAQATPSGRGGVGVIRLSGPHAHGIAQAMINRPLPSPRQVTYVEFQDAQQQALDQGLVICFSAPASFTGEDVVELQGHGGDVVMQMLLKRAVELGARLAEPGEFSKRAFLNDKLDLTQAEAIADLIDSGSEHAARCALRSLQGDFSKKISVLQVFLTDLRLYVEAAIDFPDEEGVDFIADANVQQKLEQVRQQLQNTLAAAQQGAIIRNGLQLVLVGAPNVGKSSLLNALAGDERAIVTDIAGTTRDLIREHVHIDGLPIHITDTAGIRETENKVEQIGIERTWQAIHDADVIALMMESTDEREAHQVHEALFNDKRLRGRLLEIRTKSDLLSGASQRRHDDDSRMAISAKTGDGLQDLKDRLKSMVQYDGANESGLLARTRHCDALQRSMEALDAGLVQLNSGGSGELLAEDLRYAQRHLSEITGDFTADDLLGKIFSSFCIGK